MRKQGQSLLDFISLIPLQAIHIKRSPISTKEAKVLFDIWQTDRNASGYLDIPEDVDPTVVASLTSKGLLANKDGGFHRSVDITDKGRSIIRNIILYSEKSAFEKDSQDFDYEFIHRAINYNPPIEKVANKQTKITLNWLQRALCK